jgi:hypothetical protein
MAKATLDENCLHIQLHNWTKIQQYRRIMQNKNLPSKKNCDLIQAINLDKKKKFKAALRLTVLMIKVVWVWLEWKLFCAHLYTITDLSLSCLERNQFFPIERLGI